MLSLELKTYVRRPLQMLLPWAFAGLWGILIPMLLPQSANLVVFVPALLWMILLTSVSLTLEDLFMVEHQQKMWSHWKLGSRALIVRVLTKIGVYWTIVVFPLLVLLIGMTQAWNIPVAPIALLGVLVPGSIVLTLLGALMAALSQQERPSAGILGVLLLPLLVPVLIFGTLAIEQMLQGNAGLTNGAALWLLGICCVSLALLPFLTVQALKLNFE